MKRSRTRRSRPYSGKRGARRQRTVRRKPVKRTIRKSAKRSRRSLKGGMKKNKQKRTEEYKDKLRQKQADRREGITNREKAEEFLKQVRVTDDNSSSFENYLADVRKVSNSELNGGINPYSGLPFNFNAQTIQSLSAGELPTSPPGENQKFVKIVSQEDPPPPSPEGSSDESPDQCEGEGCFSWCRKKLTLGKHKSDSDAKKTPENETTPLLATGYDPRFRKPSQTVRLVDFGKGVGLMYIPEEMRYRSKPTTE